MEFLRIELENKFSVKELQLLATKLDKHYKVNFFWDGWDLLNREIIQYINLDFTSLKNEYHYREIYNYIIMKYGKTETKIKYYLTKEYVNNNDEVCLYEFNVGNSRLDFGRINGSSYAYEIKTELDTTNRLETQISDYKSVFDYVNVVVHPKHIAKVRGLISRNVGIISYYEIDNMVKFRVERNAKLNKNILKSSQLSLLNSNDLKFIIKDELKIRNIPDFKDDRLKLVKKSILKEEFNSVFKEAIKNKNQKKWQHIKDNFDVLMPIEIQKVYSEEIEIKLVHY